MRTKRSCQFLALVCVVMLFAVASCEKMNVGESRSDEQPNVVLRVGHYEQTPFPTRAVVSDLCTRINFLVYDSSGERIRQVNQQIGDDGFGETGFYLPEGRYFLVVLAHSSNGNPTSTNAQKIGFTNKTGYTDTFLYADSLTVGTEDISRTLTLERIGAMVRFLFQDAIPARVDSIGFYYTGGSGTLDAVAGGWGVVNSKQEQEYPVSHLERKFDIYTIPHGDADKLTVRAMTYSGRVDDNHVVTERLVEGIPVLRNHITLCRGYLFSPVQGMNFDITITDIWDTDTIDFTF